MNVVFPFSCRDCSLHLKFTLIDCGVREVGVILTLPRRREDGEFTEDPLRSGAAGRVLSRPQQVLCPGQRCRQAGKTGQAYQTVQEGPNSSQGVYFWRDVRL